MQQEAASSHSVTFPTADGFRARLRAVWRSAFLQHAGFRVVDLRER